MVFWLCLPFLSNAQTAHYLIVADTDDYIIGNISNNVCEYFQQTFAPTMHQKFGWENHSVYEKHLRDNSIDYQIDNLQTSSNDVIFFYYSGHGCNSANTNEQFPAFYLNGKFCWERDIYEKLKSKPHKLLIVIAETSNRIFDMLNSNPPINGTNSTQVSDYQTNYIVSSCKRNQDSYFENGYDYFFSSFKEAFEEEIKSNNSNLSWDNIFITTAIKTEQKALENGTEQTPQWIKE